MKHDRIVFRTAFTVALAAAVISGCSDGFSDAPTGPSTPPALAVLPVQAADVDAAIAAQERHNAALFRIPGVVGTAVGLLPSGRATIRVFLATPDVQGLPTVLDNIPVSAEVTGLFMARSNPTTKVRPAPVGFSVGHPAITAGTIGYRVTDSQSRVFILSNNHVLAATNSASLGDPEYQPGPYDGGTSNDVIGTLFAFKAIDFSVGGRNTMDAAIALSNTNDLGNSTPTDDGYGLPNSAIFGDANNDGTFDNVSALLGLNVQKYGRTTKLTKGQITGINATVDVCYEAFIFFCLQSAHYVDQLIVTPGTFSAGGDSGSGIVTDDENKNPVGLLFAGSSNETIANRIDLVLNHFGVRVDGSAAPPPTPLTDIAITSVNVPSSVVQGNTVDVVVTIQNVGNQPVSGSINVALNDQTDNVSLGTQSVDGLAAGAVATRTFSWNTTGASLGLHTLNASHDLSDDNAANNQKSTTSTVGTTPPPPPPAAGMHIGNLEVVDRQNSGTSWSATVEITVHDENHQPLNGAAIVGTWTPNSFLVANECTSGDLGGNGTCIVLYPSVKKNVKSVTYSVNSVTMSGRTYSQSANHDPDGSSNGTSIKVSRP